MALKYRQTFTVEGSGWFPLDMLRYDCCFPLHESEIGRLSNVEPMGEFRSVELQRYVEIKADQPTQGLWQSFGWSVKDGSVKTEKL